MEGGRHVGTLRRDDFRLELDWGNLLLDAMQIRFSHLTGDRPSCPLDPSHTIHRHGHYDRYGDCDGDALERILRFLCLFCGRTISVLPDPLLPYRPISAPNVQEHFDAKTGERTLPPATEKQKGCLKRAWERFTRRATALAAVLGQMMQLVFPEPKLIWLQLRRWGNLPDILRRLGSPFNTSLLHDYRCLQPWTRAPG
jgi:hypothetical protein